MELKKLFAQNVHQYQLHILPRCFWSLQCTCAPTHFQTHFQNSKLAQHSTCCAFYLAPTMHLSLKVRYVLILGSAVFLSWLATFSFECYYRGTREGSSVHPRDREGPYPGATDENIFWFLQVCLHIQCAQPHICTSIHVRSL